MWQPFVKWNSKQQPKIHSSFSKQLWSEFKLLEKDVLLFYLQEKCTNVYTLVALKAALYQAREPNSRSTLPVTYDLHLSPKPIMGSIYLCRSAEAGSRLNTAAPHASTVSIEQPQRASHMCNILFFKHKLCRSLSKHFVDLSNYKAAWNHKIQECDRKRL